MPAPQANLAGRDPRVAACRVVQGVLEGRSLAELVPRLIAPIEDGRDRALAQELSYGAVRLQPRLGSLLGRLLERPLKARDRDLEALLLIGCYQLLYLRMAEHGAVHATVGAAQKLGKRWAAGLVNGVLRRLQREREALLAALESDQEARYAMPRWLLNELQQRWPESWQERIAALNGYPPMTLRVNRLQSTREAYLERLTAAGIAAAPHAVASMGIVLERPMEVERLPGFAGGMVSVQDAAAQLAAELLDPAPGEAVLDACAAPGGKTAHLLERQPELRVTAVDIDGERLERVAENLARLGLRAELLQGDASRPEGEWARRRYDRILLDVPCSATGVLRRHPDIKLLRRESDIGALAKLQRRILEGVWPLLRPGGVMLYATCSLLSRENDEPLAHFLAGRGDAVERPIPAGWGEARPVGRQIPPGESGMDGFFYALLEKRWG